MKNLQLGFTVAPCCEQSPRSSYFAGSQILSNDAMKPSKLGRHFIRSAAIFKASHWIVFQDYSAR